VTNRLSVLFLGLMCAPGLTNAAVVCQTRGGNLKVRAVCRPRETLVDPVALGLQGPKGDTGAQGPKGDPGPARSSDCAPDSVKVGSLCVDKYEESVWDIPSVDGALVAKVTSGQATLVDLTAAGATERGLGGNFSCSGNEYPAGFPVTGNWTSPVYAVSIAGVTPSNCLSWFQAEQACRLAGKHLLTNQEWQAAAAGTPDPGTDDGVTDCNIGFVHATTLTGSRSGCVSLWGAYDMVGNLWEWVADWVTIDAAVHRTSWPPPFNDEISWGGDGSPIPAAPVRGGHWGSPNPGVFAVDESIDVLLSGQGGTVGFRCGRAP